MNAPHASPPQQEASAREVRAQRFADLIRYAQRVCGNGDSAKASQRELAEKIEVAGTMITRYLSGTVDWMNIKTQTAELIAEAANLDVGSVYIWIRQGREEAFRHEARLRAKPAAFRPLDLARELTSMLEQEDVEPRTGPNYQLVREKLAAAEAAAPGLFARLVSRIGAENAVAKVEFGQALSDHEWQQINELLGEPSDPALCSPRTAARTEPLNA